MTKILAIANMKGGVGKTTLTLNLGAALVDQGKKVLLIDTDPQSNLSTAFDVDTHIPENVGTWLLHKYKFDDVLQVATDQLHLIPSAYELTDIERELSTKMGSEKLLRMALKPHKAAYDYILIDCAPNLQTMTRNAFACADEFIIPILADYFSWKGIEHILSFASQVKEYINEDIELLGIVINQYNDKIRNRLKQKVASTLKQDPNVGAKVFNTHIRTCTELAASPETIQTIFELAPESTGALDYQSLTREILQRHS